MKRLPMVMALVLGFSLAGLAVWAAEPTPVPETLDLNAQVRHPDAPGLAADRKAVPGFSHRRHAEQYLKGMQAHSRFPYDDEFRCAACHHKAADAQEAGSCLSCKTADRMWAAVGGPGNVKKLFHDLCRSCHQKASKAGAADAPTKCSGCHG